jgi:hypothetical protein
MTRQPDAHPRRLRSGAAEGDGVNYQVWINQQSCVHSESLEEHGVRFDDVRVEDR